MGLTISKSVALRVSWAVSLAGLPLLAIGFPELFWTPDQRGRWAFEKGQLERAAGRFEDPMWQGVAHFRNGDFLRAADAFGRVPTPEAAYNLGNSYARLGRFEEAVAAFDAALVERPDWRAARENRAWAAARWVDEQPEELDAPPPGDPSFDPDQIQFDEKGDQGTAGDVPTSQLTDEQLAEMWLRRLQSSPGDFLRQRFALEVAQSEPQP